MSGEGGGLLPVGDTMVGCLGALWGMLAPVLGIAACIGGFVVSYPQAAAWESLAQEVPGHVFFWPWIAFLAGALLPWIVAYIVVIGSAAVFIEGLKDWRQDLIWKYGEEKGKKLGDQLAIGLAAVSFTCTGLVIWWFVSMISMYSQYQ